MCPLCFILEVTLLTPVALLFVYLAGVAVFETGEHHFSWEDMHIVERTHQKLSSTSAYLVEPKPSLRRPLVSTA